MKKVLAAMAVGALCVSTAAHAERNRGSHSSFLKEHTLRLGVDTQISAPIGNYADVNGGGGGVFVSSEMSMSEMLSLTGRIGFQMHADRNLLGSASNSSHVNAIPFLVGGKYYLAGDREGMFGALELGLFDLMSTVTTGATSASQSDLKFGMGVGLGIQQSQWNARVSMHSQDFGHFGDRMVVSGGIGYQFGAL